MSDQKKSPKRKLSVSKNDNTMPKKMLKVTKEQSPSKNKPTNNKVDNKKAAPKQKVVKPKPISAKKAPNVAKNKSAGGKNVTKPANAVNNKKATDAKENKAKDKKKAVPKQKAVNVQEAKSTGKKRGSFDIFVKEFMRKGNYDGDLSLIKKKLNDKVSAMSSKKLTPRGNRKLKFFVKAQLFIEHKGSPPVDLIKQKLQQLNTKKEVVDNKKPNKDTKKLKKNKVQEKADEENEDEEEENSDVEDSEENDADAESSEVNGTKQSPNKQKNKQANKEVAKKTRYVLFIGNLPYEVEEADISDHFKKVGNIVSVRLQMNKATNKCKGFAYLELGNEESYQKALSMNHTFIKGRRIEVEYTKGGKKNSEKEKKEIKAKNLKLQEMRKQGLLAGSKKVTGKRSVRRAKQKSAEKK